MARRTSTRTDPAGTDVAAEMVEQQMREAVADTLRAPSPDPARALADRFLDLDDDLDTDPDRPGPMQTLALLTATSWLTTAQGKAAQERAGRDTTPDTVTWDVEAVLDWIGDHIGPRYRARTRYVRGFVDGGVSEAVGYADALGDDFLPALIWLAAGIVARHGGGDAAWLPAR